MRLAKISFDKIFDLTAGVYFNFYNNAGIMRAEKYFCATIWKSVFSRTENNIRRCAFARPPNKEASLSQISGVT